MDTQQPAPSFDESIAQVMKTLPPPIRNYLGQGKYTAVAKSLMSKYSLRIDQGGVLEREIMLLLMGIDSPDEFVKSLAEEAKLDQQVINGIVQDVNAQIFVPLREEMRKGTAQMGRNEPLRRSDLRSVLASVTSEVPPVKLLEDHEEPHINIGVRDKVQGASPPANLPGVIHHPPIIPPPSPVPIQPPPTPPPTPPVPLKPKPVVPIAPYSSDPYREPIG